MMEGSLSRILRFRIRILIHNTPLKALFVLFSCTPPPPPKLLRHLRISTCILVFWVYTIIHLIRGWWGRKKTSGKNPGLLTAYSPYGTYCMVLYWLWEHNAIPEEVVCLFREDLLVAFIKYSGCLLCFDLWDSFWSSRYMLCGYSKPIWSILGCADTPKLEKIIGMCSIVDLDLVGS